MNVLAVSDQVLNHIYAPNVRVNYPDVDLIFGCGDLPFYYLEFLASAFNVPLLYVLGNHDRGPQYTVDGRELTRVQGGCNLHGRVVYERGLIMAGLEGSMRYRPHAPLMYTEAEMRREIARLLPRLLWMRARHGRACDILITHSPPRGIHDRDDIAHTGFKVFHNLLKIAQPRYMLHGHIHLYKREPQITQFGSTTIINVYPVQLLNWSF